jgi:hypothetical protein
MGIFSADLRGIDGERRFFRWDLLGQRCGPQIFLVDLVAEMQSADFPGKPTWQRWGPRIFPVDLRGRDGVRRFFGRLTWQRWGPQIFSTDLHCIDGVRPSRLERISLNC